MNKCLVQIDLMIFGVCVCVYTKTFSLFIWKSNLTEQTFIFKFGNPINNIKFK